MTTYVINFSNAFFTGIIFALPIVILIRMSKEFLK